MTNAQNLQGETTEELVFNLREEIAKHDSLYEQNKPVITDSEYDALYLELVRLEEENPHLHDPNSPTQKIQAMIVDGLKKVAHSTPMLSQEKVTTEEGVRKFLDRGHGIVLVQEKLDGLTVVATDEGKRMTQAVTRGSGYIGEDVTHSLQTFKNVPTSIPFAGKLEVRMEALVPFEEFERINVDGRYSNPRNLASGTVRQLDATITKERNLKGIVFDLISAEDMDFEDDLAQLDFMQAQGYEVVHTKAFSIDTEEGKEALIKYVLNYAEKVRPTLPHMIDGLILKFNDLGLREELGTASKYPKWAIAYKFPSLDATTTLKNIVFQVGKTGQITPVAEFDEVEIDSVRISRATLHNFRNIREKDIRIGDRVVIARANDVIPQVVQSVHTLRDGNEVVVGHPETCPSCSTPTIFNGENLYCPNSDCEPQKEGKLEHFVSRDAMNVDGLGEKTITQLYREGFIQDVTDVYRLADKKELIVKMEGFGVKKYDKMIAGIEASKINSFHQVLYAFSIPLIGRTASRTLAKHYVSVHEMLKASEEPTIFKQTLISIPDIGETMANSLITFLSLETTKQLINELGTLGLEMKSDYVAPKTDTAISGKTFVITGALSKGRNEYKEEIESLGGKVSGSVSKKTDYLLMGPDAAGSSKHTKAVDLGVVILSEEAYLAMNQ